MDELQGVYTVGIAVTIIAVIFTLYFLGLFIFLLRKMKKVSARKIRDKRKRRRKKNELRIITNQKNKVLKKMIVFFLLTILSVGGTTFLTYYQETNLSTADTQYVTEGYFYIRDLQAELKKIEIGGQEEIASKKNVNYMATALAGYRLKEASTLNTVEGQSVLNRYYTSLSELGINVSKQLNTIYDKPTQAKALLKDCEKVLDYQKKAFEFYKIDESVLNAQK